MATLPAPGVPPSPPQPSDVDERLLALCRQWLHPRMAGAGGSSSRLHLNHHAALGACPDRYDSHAALRVEGGSNLAAARYGYYCTQQQQRQQQASRTASYSAPSLESVAARVHSGSGSNELMLDSTLDDDEDYDAASGVRLASSNNYEAIGGDCEVVDDESDYAVASLPAAGSVVNGVAPPPADAPGSAMPSAGAIAQIFQVGQPPQGLPAKRVSRAQRASQWVRRLVARSGRGSSSDLARECSSAVVDAFSAEAALVAAIRVLARSRDTHSAAFRARADRVHTSQSRLLGCLHSLVSCLVPAAEQPSRHYRFYLPEEDQLELDRGFSESVLFAAQALARGFQIRGTEPRTLVLREPAAMLCAAWAAARHVLAARGCDLWRAWQPAAPHSPDIDALRRVLTDFDDAWVRFERDLCFAYFGLAHEPADLDDADVGRVAHEEEFSLLVVLLSETLMRCLSLRLLSTDLVEAMDPQVILSLPRLAILHAIAHGSIDGLCFVPSAAAPIFWWFREYTAQCVRIHAAVAAMPPSLYAVLMRMLVSDEADRVLAKAAPILADALPPPADSDTLVASPRLSIDRPPTARRMTMDDLESIIDSPRSARSMSIDCISSICASPPSGLGSPTSLCCKACAMPDSERLAARLYAVCCSELPLPRCCSLQLQPSPVLVHATLQVSSAPTISHNSSAASAAAKEEADRAARLAACHASMKQTYVDVCTVADSLHSGPFARPFRFALELVFSMNSADEAS